MNAYYKLLLGFVLVLAVLISGCDQNRINCVKSNGHWTTFPDSCVDSCDFERGITSVCSEVLTAGCDCGTNKCWNGTGCELN